MKKLLIFGAGGFVGKSMLMYLEKMAEYNVVKVFHKSGLTNQKNCFSVDISDQEQVNAIIVNEKPDQIINLAGINSLGIANQMPQMTVDVNVKGTINILESIKRNQLDCKILVVGSSEEYAQSDYILDELSPLGPRNIYGMTKLWQEMAAEQYHKECGIKVICARSFNHTGIFQSERAMVASFCKQTAQIERGKRNNTLYVGNLNVERDISDVRDVVRAYLMLLDSNVDFGIFNVCSGKRIKLRNLLETIMSFATKEINVIPDEQRMRNVDIPVIYGDNKKISQVVNWKPQIELNTTLKDIYEYHLAKEG